MKGETDLPTLLRLAAPRLAAGEYVFVTVPDEAAAQGLAPLGTFVEAEGITAICARERAIAAGLPFEGTFRQITLTIHSSLHAVGFLAVVTTRLATAGISCNAIAAFYHDHLFVPAVDADRALQVLSNLATATMPDGANS